MEYPRTQQDCVPYAQGVKERAGTKWSVYKLAFKDSLRKLCLMRHLIVHHVYCAGIKSGYVFSSHKNNAMQPSQQSTEDEDVHMGSGILYTEFDKWITDWLKLNTWNNGDATANWDPHNLFLECLGVARSFQI